MNTETHNITENKVVTPKGSNNLKYFVDTTVC